MNIIFEKLRSCSRSLRYGITNCVKWFPIVWKDRDWDQYYLYNVLGFKLAKMAQFQKNDGTSVDNESISAQLREASELCKKVSTYDYSADALQDFKKQYPDFDLELIKTPSGDGLYRFNLNFDDMPQEFQKLYRQYDQIAEENQNHDRKKLFDLIYNHVECWWD